MTPDAAERRARALLDGHSLARDAAPDLARDVLALAAALRTERAAREAAEAQHAALAAAVRAYLDADRDWRRSRYMIAEHINAAAVENTERLRAERYAAWAALDALLRGAPCGYVEARVVREYLDAADASRRITGESYDALDDGAIDDWRTRHGAASKAKVAARTALDAALATTTTTPKESR